MRPRAAVLTLVFLLLFGCGQEQSNQESWKSFYENGKLLDMQ